MSLDTRRMNSVSECRFFVRMHYADTAESGDAYEAEVSAEAVWLVLPVSNCSHRHMLRIVALISVKGPTSCKAEIAVQARGDRRIGG